MLVIAFVVTIGTAFLGFDSVTGEATACLLNCTLLLALIWRRLPSTAWWLQAAPVLGWVAAALGWATMATAITVNGWPDFATGKLLADVAGVAALLIGALAVPLRREGRAVLDTVMLLATGWLLLGLVARQGLLPMLASGIALSREDRFTGLIGNANVTAAIAATIAVFAGSRLTAPLARLPGRGIQLIPIVYGPVFVIGLGIVLIAGSRLVSITLAAVLALFAVEWLMRHRTRLRRDRFLGGAIAATLLMLVIAQYAGLLRFRFETLAAGGADRIATWTHLMAVAGNRPLLGYGLGSFPTVNAHFLTDPRFAQANWALNSPHNLLLQCVLQAGWPYAALIGMAVVTGLRQRLVAGALPFSRDDWATVAIVLLVLVNAMADVTLDMPAPVTLLLFIIGLSWGRVLGRDVRIPLARAEIRGHERAISERLAR